MKIICHFYEPGLASDHLKFLKNLQIIVSHNIEFKAR
jgi:hypothetical protein